ncbi:SH3 domain-containing protein [Splendidivirga corallicola]
MIIANILIAVFGLVGTLAAFGGDTWVEGEEPILKRVTKRGWIALIALFITFATGVIKEVRSHQISKVDEEKKVVLERENKKQRERIALQLNEIQDLQSKIDSQVIQTKDLQAKLDSTSSKLADVIDRIGSQQLASIEAAFKLAILRPRETDQTVLHLNGQRTLSIPSLHYDQMQLYWGDQFHFVVYPESDDIQASDLVNLKLQAGEKEYPLHDGTGNGFFEETIRIHGRDPRPMIAKIYNPDRLRNISIKITIRTTDSSQGQEEFRRLILNSPFSEFAKKLYKRTTPSILYVRANANKNGQRRSSLAKGSFVRVLQTQGTWTEITTPEGRQGWVMSEYLGEIN